MHGGAACWRLTSVGCPHVWAATLLQPCNPVWPQAVPSPPIALDEWLRQRFFYRRAGGLFVEVGAGGGLAPESATHLLAQHGWHGLLTEARPAQYAALAASRREAVCVNAAPCAEFSGQADELSVVPCVPLQHLLDRCARGWGRGRQGVDRHQQGCRAASQRMFSCRYHTCRGRAALPS